MQAPYTSMWVKVKEVEDITQGKRSTIVFGNWYTPQWKWLASILLNNKGNIVFNTKNKGCHIWKWSSEISALLNEISLKDESKRDNYCSNSPSMNNLQNKHCWPVHVAIALQLPLFLPKDCGFAWSFQQLSLVSLGFLQ